MKILLDPKSTEGGGITGQMFVPSSDGQIGGAPGGEALSEEETQTEEQGEQEEGKAEAETNADKAAEEADTGKKEVKFSNFLDAAGAASERENSEDEALQKQKPTAKGQQQQTTPKTEQQQAPARDYAGLPEEVVPLFKGMSNKSFEKLKPIYLEHLQHQEIIKQKDAKITELQKGVVALPEYYFEHPQGYLLDPTYAQAEANETLAKNVVSHWSLQLARIRRGEQWQDLIEDEKGNIRMDKPQAATSEAEAMVGNYLMACQQQYLKAQNELEQVTKSFSTKHKEDLTLLKEGEAKYFPDFDKPDHPTAAIQKEVLKALPPSFRSSPLASVLAKTAAANAMLRAEIAELKKGKPGAGNGKATNKQPTKNRTGAASGSEAKGEEVKFSDFTQMLS
jgi:hypothetical protein